MTAADNADCDCCKDMRVSQYCSRKHEFLLYCQQTFDAHPFPPFSVDELKHNIEELLSAIRLGKDSL